MEQKMSSSKSLFQKRHYDFLAKFLRETSFLAGYDDMVIRLALALAADNDQFDHDRFIKAVYKKVDVH
jgi:hypothetical protein